MLRNKYKLDCGWKEETFDGGVCKRRTRLKTNHVDREKRSYPTKKKKSEKHITKAKNPGSEQIHNIQLGLKGN